ncbi:hypothetical protein A2850_04120 [Candidatus Azambacteria bacterium RIFCSPHIGHO2_01_FULL_51_74]|nr:MAG: hypothetical protein A2850_04120 [Candidatus Azambacteria bacterium RIFCSPHIGHO2_01_FULL_51_74]
MAFYHAVILRTRRTMNWIFQWSLALRSAGCEQNRIEKLENEMISRRDDENVVCATLRRSNKEISHFQASPRAGEFGQASVLLVAHPPQADIAPCALNLARMRSAQSILF